MQNATDVLRQEHQTIKGALGFAEKIAAKINRGEEMPSDGVQKLMEFIRLFVERCHHGKDDQLRAMMEEMIAGNP